MNAGAFAADYFDGRTSRRYPVSVEVDNAGVRVRGDGVSLELVAAALEPQPRVGRMPLRIRLPGGGLLVAEADAAGAVIALPRASGIAHALESRLEVVLASLVGLVVAVVFAYVHGVPWLAREVAMRLPPEIEARIAQEGIAQLDRFFFSPTQLDDARRAGVERQFARLQQSAGPVGRAARLEFRDGGIVGANALALPGGLVVVTDRLVAWLDDERLAAVLAHELGHLEHRHGSRHILQDTLMGLVAMAIAGDASVLAGLAAMLPVTLLNNGYTRDFEREADRYAFDLLRSTGRSPALFAEALEGMEAAHEAAVKDVPRRRGRFEVGEEDDARAKAGRRNFDYVSTHPATGERIRAAREAAR